MKNFFCKTTWEYVFDAEKFNLVKKLISEYAKNSEN